MKKELCFVESAARRGLLPRLQICMVSQTLVQSSLLEELEVSSIANTRKIKTTLDMTTHITPLLFPRASDLDVNRDRVTHSAQNWQYVRAFHNYDVT